MLPYFFMVEFRQPQLFLPYILWIFFYSHLTMLNSLFIFNTSEYVAKLILYFFLDNWLWIQNS